MLEKMFTAALEISLTSSIAILLLAFFSGKAEKKYSAKWRYWVWAVISLCGCWFPLISALKPRL